MGHVVSGKDEQVIGLFPPTDLILWRAQMHTHQGLGIMFSVTDCNIFWRTQNIENNYKQCFNRSKFPGTFKGTFLEHFKCCFLNDWEWLRIAFSSKVINERAFAQKHKPRVCQLLLLQSTLTTQQPFNYIFKKSVVQKINVRKCFLEHIRVDERATNTATQCQTIPFFPAVCD